MKNRKLYNIINIIVLLITLFLFVINYFNFYNIQHVLLFGITVIIVHYIKALRLYLALCDTNINTFEYIKTYCKVTPVSIILPFKTGELFRMYCYGSLINNGLKGTVIILLDRFADTSALVTVILLITLLTGNNLSILIYMLVLFLLSMIFLYKIFPDFYGFLKKYYISAKATKQKLKSLKYIDMSNKVYKEISQILTGRGMILYFLSLIAWFVELLNLFIITGSLNNKISEYLFAALGIKKSTEINQFILISLFILISIYLTIKLTEYVRQKRKRNVSENHYSLR